MPYKFDGDVEFGFGKKCLLPASGMEADLPLILLSPALRGRLCPNKIAGRA